MVATNTSQSKTTDNLISRLAADFPAYKFIAGKQDHWSPGHQTITYNPNKSDPDLVFSLFHELAHAELSHKNYSSDIELLRLESEAWQFAAKLSSKYGFEITDEHIQDCLDSYRDWLHRRSACPKCGLRVLQTDSETYECFNCHKKWAVTPDRFSRAYRKSRVKG